MTDRDGPGMGIRTPPRPRDHESQQQSHDGRRRYGAGTKIRCGEDVVVVVSFGGLGRRFSHLPLALGGSSGDVFRIFDKSASRLRIAALGDHTRVTITPAAQACKAQAQGENSEQSGSSQDDAP